MFHADWLIWLVLEHQLLVAHNFAKFFLNELINQCLCHLCKRMGEQVNALLSKLLLMIYFLVDHNVYLYFFQVKLLEKGITFTMTNAKVSQILKYKSILRRQGTLLVLPLTLRSLLLLLSLFHTHTHDHANACMQNISFYLLFCLWD